jgi:DNA-binding CsgD family transcriptional regulator
VSSTGTIQFAGGLAGRWLNEFFEPTNNGSLPVELRKWLHTQSRTDSPFVARQGKARLYVKRQVSYSLNTINLLLEKIDASDSNWPRRHGSLTARELEVLTWLGRGKTNADIAAILGISAATVGKHLEHIYPKLGVENRTAAASFSPERDTGGHI